MEIHSNGGRPVFGFQLSRFSGGMKIPKSQKPSEFKGEISKNRKNPQNLNAFQKNLEFTGARGGTHSDPDGGETPIKPQNR